VGIPHSDLFHRFRHALGVTGTDLTGVHIKVVAWQEFCSVW
jgi:hypothetical protein